MYAIADVKERLIEHLMTIDLNKMSMMDLSTYTNMVCQMITMDKPDYTDRIMSMAQLMMPKPVDEGVKEDG